ncbi:Imm52 family immunity protein [Mycolicibacterium sp. 22603]|uniref:Imm52 family immunity protein n=1 Tax=Mycolicibacterium sp. 22603 TaxID=3453950 RepID=UPI003F868A48
MPQSYVGAYWRARAESVDDAADRTKLLLDGLAGIDPVLSGWRDGGKSKRQALAQPIVNTDHGELVSRLLGGRNHTDVGHQVLEELGYRVGWWNGAENYRTAAKLSVHIAVTSAHVGNNVVLELPDSDFVPQLYEPITARKLLSIVIDVFGPDWAVWTSHQLVEKQREPDRPTEDGRGLILGRVSGHPAGWANYLSDIDEVHVDEAKLPKSAKLERLNDGSLVTIGDHPASPPVSDVLGMRVAMGYPPPQDLTSHETTGAAAGEKAGSGSAPVEARNPEQPAKAATEEGKSLS